MLLYDTDSMYLYLSDKHAILLFIRSNQDSLYTPFFLTLNLDQKALPVSSSNGNGGSKHVRGTFPIIMLCAVLISSFYRLENRNSEDKELFMVMKY